MGDFLESDFDFDELLPSGRSDGLLVLFRATKPFDTHVSDILLNVFRSSTFGPTSQRLTAPSLGK